MIGLMHTHAIDDSIAVDFGINMIKVTMLTSMDLVVSKLGRLNAVDQNDIRILACAGLITENQCQREAERQSLSMSLKLGVWRQILSELSR